MVPEKALPALFPDRMWAGMKKFPPKPLPLRRSELLSRTAALAIFVASATGCDDDDDDRGTPPRDAAGDLRDATADAPRSDGGAPDLVDARPVDAADGAADTGSIAASRPETRAFSPTLAQQLRTPAGFAARVFASGLGNPRFLAVDTDGSVYVTLRAQSQVLRLRDTDNDGDASEPGERTVVASAMTTPALEGVHGITIAGGRMYLASVKAVVSAPLSGGQLGAFTTLVSDLPDGGQHPNRTLAVGPDGKLYVTVGSSCNACGETNPEHATVLRLNLDGTAATNPANPAHPMLARNPMSRMSPRVFASGLRNTLGFDWHPTTGELWGSDHGSDGLGNDLPPDEINRIEAGKSYGWPFCWGARQIDPIIEEPSMMTTKAQYCPTTAPVLAEYPAHSAPIGFLFYRGGQFPAAYNGDAFVAFRGSWNRDVPTGYKVVRVNFENGVPAAIPGQSSPIEDFLTGFLIENGRAHFGRLAGLAVDATGALLVAEDTNGVIYRVTHGSDGGDGGVGDAGVVDAASDAPADAAADAGADAAGGG
ncbi:MAG TPA: PQQ-dependent sugar dehydrogenase [Polyangia bacterium]